MPEPSADPLAWMLEARSVAVVGASAKPDSLGHQMMVEIERGGFGGAVYPVNPGYAEILGYRCFPSIADVPEPVDLAILGVSNARIERALMESVSAGAKSAVTFSSLYEDPSDTPAGSPTLIERLAAIARENSMPFCGGNGMGFLNIPSRLRATGFATPDLIREGPVTLISHSGSAFAAFAFSDRGFGFDLLISSGQEIVTTMSDYMAFALARERTRVLALLMETVRDPDGFRTALASAAERDVPVIALKVGRTEGSKAMVAAHSGALAGEHGAYEALFDAYGVHEVKTVDEMADAIELFSCPRRVGKGGGIASVHDSGGERALFTDLAQDIGVPFAQISPRTSHTLEETLDPGLEPTNPLDAWGTGIDADRIFRDCFKALHDDPDTAALAFVIDLTHQGEPYDVGYIKVAREVFASTDKPFCVVSNLASTVDNGDARVLRDIGIPVLEGAGSGLQALKHLLDFRAFRERPPIQTLTQVQPAMRDRWRARLATGGPPLSEKEGLGLLSDYGIPVAEVREASTAEDAIAAAEEVGWPVVLKTAVPGITHKSDVGGLKMDLRNAQGIGSAYSDLSSRLGPQVLVSRMAPEGVEVALGIINDPTFGPLVLVGAGGVLVELLRDRRLALPPVDANRAGELIGRLKIAPLLEGMRGAEPADIGSLARAIARLSVLASDLGDLLSGLDSNPVIVSPEGAVAVDALVIPKGQRSSVS